MNQNHPEMNGINRLGAILPERRQVVVYLRKLGSTVLEAAILLAVSIAGYTALLYVCRASWNLYLSTYMGKQFVHYFPQAAMDTAMLLQMDPLPFATRIILHAFVVCLAVAVPCRLLYVTRYIHEQFGVPGRVLLCGPPLTILVAIYIQPLYGFQELSTAVTAALLPTLFVFSPCFTYAEKLLPELGELKKTFTA